MVKVTNGMLQKAASKLTNGDEVVALLKQYESGDIDDLDDVFHNAYYFVSAHAPKFIALLFYSEGVDVLKSVKFVPRMFLQGVTEVKTITIPDNIINIGEYAFQEATNLSRVIMEEGCELIDTGAFLNCSNLKEITIPKSISYIETDAFTGTGLQEVTFADPDDWYDDDDEPLSELKDKKSAAELLLSGQQIHKK